MGALATPYEWLLIVYEINTLLKKSSEAWGAQMLKMKNDRMPDIAFRIMSFMFKIRDFFSSVDKILYEFDIHKGDTIIDYGCGPGRYLKMASSLVGEKGRVYAADIHELAINASMERIKKYNLKNISTVQIDKYSCPVEDNTADVIYALDMFHMVSEPENFLAELHRIIKKDGHIIIEDGHQSRKKTRSNIDRTGLWSVVDENKRHLKCNPI